MPRLRHRASLPLDEDTARAVRSIDASIRQAFILLEALDRRVLGTLAPPLTTAQYHALVALDDAPTQSLAALAERLLCAKANASGLIDRLSALGLVSRVADPRDARRVQLSLTPAGRGALTQATQARTQALTDALRGAHPVDGPGLRAIAGALNTLVAFLRDRATDPDAVGHGDNPMPA
jgi:DNA-binding MarR family transcriptional regulator